MWREPLTLRCISLDFSGTDQVSRGHIQPEPTQTDHGFKRPGLLSKVEERKELVSHKKLSGTPKVLGEMSSRPPECLGIEVGPGQVTTEAYVKPGPHVTHPEASPKEVRLNQGSSRPETGERGGP